MDREQTTALDQADASGRDEAGARLATTAMVLGIVGVVFVPLGIAAIIMGRRALDQISDSSRFKGRGRARLAIALGVVGIVVLLVALILPALGAARRPARGMKNTTQVRGMLQGMFVYAGGNGEYMPGLDSSGQPVDLTVEGRFKLMLDNNHFSGEYIISPSETKTVWTTGPLTTENYSYAMLDISEDNARRRTWRGSVNAQAIVISDRNTGASTLTTDVMSIHTDSPGNWRGSVGWADGRETFEEDCLVDTRYGDAPGHTRDHLFEQAGSDDAAMIYSGE